MTNRAKWLRETAKALRSGKFDINAVTEEWQRKALLLACPTDGSELHEAYPSKLEERADAMRGYLLQLEDFVGEQGREVEDSGNYDIGAYADHGGVTYDPDWVYENFEDALRDAKAMTAPDPYGVRPVVEIHEVEDDGQETRFVRLVQKVGMPE